MQLAWLIPRYHLMYLRLVIEESCRDLFLHLLLSKRSADDRLISMLLSLSARHQKRGLSRSQFRLPMSRYDIANYLGLAVEPVSRIFTRLNKKNLVIVKGREIDIPCLESLKKAYRSE